MLLTEDEGIIIGEMTAPAAGRKISITGRINNAEIRGAVIPMQIDLNKVEFLCHSGISFEEMKCKTLRPFADEVVSFLPRFHRSFLGAKPTKHLK